MANLVYLHCGVGEQVARLFHLHAVEMVQRTLAGGFFEHCGEVAHTVAHVAGQIVELQSPLQIFPHETHCHVNQCVGSKLLAVGVSLPELLDEPHGAEIIVQEARGVAHVLKTVAIVDGEENLLKDIVAVRNARSHPRLHIEWSRRPLAVEVSMYSAEMYPVDGPRVIVVAPIDMTLSGRQNYILSCGHVKSMVVAAHAVVTFALHTIKEHVLHDGSLALTKVMCSVGIVANVGYVETRHKRVGLLHFYCHGRQHQRAFAHKSIFQV